MGKGIRAGRKAKTGRSGVGNMQAQLKQAQALRREMERQQEELESKEFSATAGGGAVSVTLSGKKEIQRLIIKKDVVDPDDVEMLQDLIVAAVNEGLRQVDEAQEQGMSALTNGLDVPGYN